MSHWEAVCGVYNTTQQEPECNGALWPGTCSSDTFQVTAESLLLSGVTGVSQPNVSSPLAPGVLAWHTLSNVSHLLQGGAASGALGRSQPNMMGLQFVLLGSK